jgi:CheY-like chemotaxis protein
LPRIGARVLVAEDNAVNQKVIRVMLERLGCESEVVPTGRAAVEAAAGGGWDLILMDCQMPEMDGYEATRRIRAAESKDRHVRIVALTAGAMQGERERCMEAGMDDFMTKPVHIDALARTLSKTASQNAPQTSATAEADTLDLERLREMVGDDEELIDELVRSFLDSSAEGIEALATAIALGDALAVRLAAHSLKGASGNFGAERMRSVSAELETESKDGNLADAPAKLAILRECLDALGSFVHTRRVRGRKRATSQVG